jgi:hypothetical protein
MHYRNMHWHSYVEQNICRFYENGTDIDKNRIRGQKAPTRLLLYNVSMSQTKTVRLTETVKAAG